MQGWHTPYLGLRELPREFSQFELQAFFTFGRAELELIERRRRRTKKMCPRLVPYEGGGRSDNFVYACSEVNLSLCL